MPVKVSIIVPVYNCEAYITKCIDSILENTFKDFELILINDASTDSSPVIIHNYKSVDHRIRVIDLSENQRQGAARNIGIREALSDFILFVDADDWIAPTTLQSVIDNQNQTGADIVAFNLINYFDEHNQQIEIKYKSSSSKIDPRIFILNSPAPWQALFRKSLFLHGLMFPEHTFFEDASIMPAIFLSASKISLLNDAYYFYRRNNISTCRKKDDYRFFERIRAMERFYDNMNELGFKDKYHSEIEYQFLKVALLDSIVGGIKNFTTYPKEKIIEACEVANKYFPNWKDNPYMKQEKGVRRVLYSIFRTNIKFGILVSNIASRIINR